MLVDLNRFSMICANVLRSTPGNSASTDLAVADALSIPNPARGGVWLYVPSALPTCRLACLSSCSTWSWASWFSRSRIRASVVFGSSSLGLCVARIVGNWGGVVVGQLFWELSRGKTRSTISSSWDWSSSRMSSILIASLLIEAVLGLSSCRLGGAGVEDCGVLGRLSWLCSLKVWDWELLGARLLYSLDSAWLLSVSASSLGVFSRCSSSVSCSLLCPYRAGGWRERVIFRIPPAVPVPLLLVAACLPPRLDPRLIGILIVVL